MHNKIFQIPWKEVVERIRVEEKTIFNEYIVRLGTLL